MKAKIIPFFPVLLFIFVLLTSCNEITYKVFTGNAPVYMTYDELRASVSIGQDVELENPGKIYFKDDFIFIVEERKGIHVFDNSNPSAPVKRTYIAIPGVVDISISGNIMYADSYIDLVILDLQDIDNIHETGRVKDVLPFTVPPVDNGYPMAWIDEQKGVVIGWELKKVREESDNYNRMFPMYKQEDYYDMVNISRASSGISGSGVGTGGSMARFGIKGDYLYILGEYTVDVFDISAKTNPQHKGTAYSVWGSETMFLTEKYMFIGTSTGMMILDISNPLSPQPKNFFTHARSCDPVIVDDTLAYITLRSGTACGGVTNSLSVVNVKNIDLPKLVKSYSMTNPHGLGKEGDLLFVCDGSAGLKIFDASDPETITSHLIKEYPGINAYDVIPLSGLLVLIGEDGLYQYDYSDLQNISLISSILISK